MATLDKICPYCGQLLHNFSLKCTSCNKWVDNAVFSKLCQDDITTIKENDLTIVTPSLLSMMIIGIITESSLEESICKIHENKLNDTQKFNLLVFNSYSFYKATLGTRKKQGHEDDIKEALNLAILHAISTFFVSVTRKSYPIKKLIYQGLNLYDQIESIVGSTGVNTDSMSRASNSLGSIILLDQSPLSFVGLSLLKHFFTQLVTLENEFSKLFLVEEEDFDWQSVISTD